MRAEWTRLEGRLGRPVPVSEFAMAVDAWSERWTRPPAEIAETVRAWRAGADIDASLAPLCAEVARRYSGRFHQHPRLAAYMSTAQPRESRPAK